MVSAKKIFPFAEFWKQIEQEWAEHEKALLYYDMDYADDWEDDTEYCDYTSEECIGNKLFCEECPVFT